MGKIKETQTHNWDFFNESAKKKKTLLDKIQAIGTDAFKTDSWTKVCAAHEKSLLELASYLGTSDFQTGFFVAVFYAVFFLGKRAADFSMIQEFFSVRQIMLMKRKKEIFDMQTAGLINIGEPHRVMRHRFIDDDDEERKPSFCNCEFIIPDAVADAIVKGSAIPQEKQIQTTKDFLEKVSKISKACLSNDYMDFEEETILLENECKNRIEGIAKVKRTIPYFLHRALFYFVCLDSISARRNECILVERIKQISGDSSERNTLLRELISAEKGDGKNILIDAGLIEINGARIAEDSTAVATNKAYELLFGKDAELYKSKIQSKELIKTEEIISRKLFFHGETKAQIERLSNSLNDEKFKAIKKRLKQKGMNQGIAALFYGPPGTGKTESVMQLAKESGRDVYHVDISQAKTMWYGESPKIVKRIFKNYKSFCDDAEREGRKIPILLFNEADAIISKRKEVTGNTSECDKESNSIQNVVLEEMEKLEGIMVATTNLADNMDSAFERRFLFKVEFKMPDSPQRAKIWRSKIKSLGAEDANALAQSYEFSGAEIDNISRKVELEEVITGIRPDIAAIRDFCKSEKLNGNEKCTIGFIRE